MAGYGLLASALAGGAAGIGAGMVTNAKNEQEADMTKLRDELMTKREELLQRLRNEGAQSLQKSAQDYSRPFDEGKLAEEKRRTDIADKAQQSTERYQTAHIGVMQDANEVKRENERLRELFRSMTAGMKGGSTFDDQKEAMQTYDKMIQKINEDITIKDKQAAVAALEPIFNQRMGLPAQGAPAQLGDQYGVRTWRGFKPMGNTPDALKAAGYEIPGAPKPPATPSATAPAAATPAAPAAASTPWYMRGLPSGQIKIGQDQSGPSVPPASGIISGATTDPDEELRRLNSFGG